MNRKGQALVEFVLIVPVLIFFIVGLIDVGNLIYKKLELENKLDTVVDLYQANESNELKQYLNEHKLSIKYTSSDKYLTIAITQNIKITTPILKDILKSPYQIKAGQTIYVRTKKSE